MVEAVIIVVIVLIVIFAVKGSIKHMKGQGSCCGGGSTPIVPKKDLNGKVVMTKIVGIEGMHCDRCKSRVEIALNGIDGLRASVSLNRNQATVEADRHVASDTITDAIEKAGYKVTSIL